MISDKHAAERVSKATERLLVALSEALIAAQDSPVDEIDRLHRAIGQVVGTLEIELLSPLYRAHPDLEPAAPKSESRVVRLPSANSRRKS